jgi:hypothetical protein
MSSVNSFYSRAFRVMSLTGRRSMEARSCMPAAGHQRQCRRIPDGRAVWSERLHRNCTVVSLDVNVSG